MYKNLKMLLRNKGISIKDYADFLGVSEKTAHNKLNGITQFTFQEVKKTKMLLFPQYDIMFLFSAEKSA